MNKEYFESNQKTTTKPNNFNIFNNLITFQLIKYNLFTIIKQLII